MTDITATTADTDIDVNESFGDDDEIDVNDDYDVTTTSPTALYSQNVKLSPSPVSCDDDAPVKRTGTPSSRKVATPNYDDNDVKPTNNGRHGFFIQDILRPEFGSRQLTEQYYAYLQYCCSLQMHNMMLLRGAAMTATNNVMTSPLAPLPTHAQYKRAVVSPVFHQRPSELQSHLFHKQINAVNNLKERCLSNDTSGNQPKAEVDSGFRKKRRTSGSRSHAANDDPANRQPDARINIATSPRVGGISNAFDAIDKTGRLSTCDVIGSPAIHEHRHDDDSRMQADDALDGAGASRLQQRHDYGDTSSDGGSSSSDTQSQARLSEDSGGAGGAVGDKPWPAWVYCTRYSDRPSSGKTQVQATSKHVHNYSNVFLKLKPHQREIFSRIFTVDSFDCL